MATLTVAGLWYEPAVDVVQLAEDHTRYFLDTYVPPGLAKIMPHLKSERSMNTRIHNVTFRCRPGEISVLLTKSAAGTKWRASLAVTCSPALKLWLRPCSVFMVVSVLRSYLLFRKEDFVGARS
jgi:hypothetical protein